MIIKITDGKKTVEIRICRWNGSGYDPDWSTDYFNAGSLPFDPETETYTVDNVDYCIAMAQDGGEEGARAKFDEDGNAVPDEDMFVFVDVL